VCVCVEGLSSMCGVFVFNSFLFSLPGSFQLHYLKAPFARLRVCVCFERERLCVCCVYLERENERKGECVCLLKGQR